MIGKRLVRAGQGRGFMFASVIALIVLAALVVAWPELSRRMCAACAPADVQDLPRHRFARVHSAEDINTLIAHRTSLETIRNGTVPRIYTRALPRALGEIENLEQRKNTFILAVLPQVLRLNEAIHADRQYLLGLWQRMDGGQPVSAAEQRRLMALAALYDVQPTMRATLLRRVDVIPPSLALSQAAIESGWGTSRFAQHGNAIFGQRTFDDQGHGLDPVGIEEANFRVKRFPSLMRSAWGYMLTLNSHPAYREFRLRREQARAEGATLDSTSLAETLTPYSEKGASYVALIQRVIRANRLREFDRTTLVPAAP
jgi:Bax protein